MIGSKATVQLADELLGIAREIDPSIEPKYNKHYIGLWKDGQPFNFCAFRPRKSTVNLEVKMPRSEKLLFSALSTRNEPTKSANLPQSAAKIG
jgi:predicted transport protein